MRFDHLIIGGGMTAAAALAGLRERDLGSRIGLLTAEPHAPYSRPPLSKALWKNGVREDTVWRPVPAGAELMLGRRAVRLDLDRKEVTDQQGETYGFGKLLLATGGRPRTLPNASERVIYFRTLDDFRRLRDLTRQPARVVVIGGGFIGTEIAAALRWSGHQVTMLVPEQGLCARQFPLDLGIALVGYYREKGVDVRLGQTAVAILDRGKHTVVRAASGEELVADVVVAGLGLTPETALAEQAGLTVNHGIVVDEYLRTSHPEVYAAGDVAVFYSPALGRQMRVEHEDNANTMGRLAGHNMAGEPTPYHHLPFFYSDLFELGYEAVGELDARHQTVAEWKERFREGVIYYHDAGRMRGVLLWNTWGKVDAARALIGGPATGRLS